MKKSYLWPASLAVIYTASIIIIFSPVHSKTIIPLPAITPTPAPIDEVVVDSSPATPLVEYKSQKNNLSFQYPEFLKITEKNNQITLSNNFTITFNIPVPSQVKVNNFTVDISYTTTKPNVEDTISRGNYIYQVEFDGLEGTGEKNYYLQIGTQQKWLKISHKLWLDSDVEQRDRQNIKYINSADQATIVDQILSSLKINQELSHWQTYKNEKLGFEFQYPNDWEIKITDSSISVSANKWRPDQPEGGGSFTVEKVNSYQDFAKDYDIDTNTHPTISPYCTKNCISYSKLYLIDNTPISHKTTKHFRTTTEVGFDVDYFFVENESKNFLISIFTDDKIHSQILSTFKFTK